MMQKIAIVLSFLTLLGTASADAEPDLTLLKNVLGDRQPDSVAPAAAAGWYEVVFDTQIFYLSEDGRYVMQGDMNPVTEHYELGVALGVRGTPSIVTANGQMIPGYLPADRLLQTISQ